VNAAQPRATAIAISHGRIVAVGSDDDVKNISLPGAQAINLDGAFVLPGLIDAHVHLEWTGLAMQRVELYDMPTLDAAVSKVRERAQQTPKGKWVTGRGWNQSDWGGELPTAAHLDGATTEHPVFLNSRSGHSGWANSAALRLAGVDANTADPAGGEIVRDANGNPIGLFLETAMDLIGKHIPPPTPQEEEEAALLAMRAMNKAGLTGVHCMDGEGGIQNFGTYQRLREQRQSTLRVVKMLPVQALDHAIGAGLRAGFGDAWLRIGGIKVFSDGALGPKSAAMVQPYEGEPNNRGIDIYDKETLIEFAVKAMTHGLSVTTHAIGDRANHDILDAYAVGMKEAEGSRHSSLVSALPHRHLRNRIEHAQVLQPSDIARFAAQDVIASMQPIHATSDYKMVDAYWGARGRYAYAWRDLLNSGARLALGSDAPVETFDPLAGIHAAVTRQRADGTPEGGWYPDQRLTMAEAIYGYTLGAAYAGYGEHELGSIEVGKLADLTVLSHDLTKIGPNEILNVKVERVMVDGAWVSTDASE
jgi:predicted amidohydrolase YtcJ